MKLELDKEWFENHIRQDEDFEVGAGNPTIADERESANPERAEGARNLSE